MFATVHTASALLIASKTSNPWWIFFIGLISHFILDFIPHGDRNLDNGLYNDQEKRSTIIRLIWITLSDLFISLILSIYYLIYTNFTNWQAVIFAVFVVLFPDLFMGLSKIIYAAKKENIKNIFIKIILIVYGWHKRIHDFLPNKMRLEIGLILQIFIIFIFLALAFAK
jgi:hypothetical protein